jgi:hypothetical protein
MDFQKLIERKEELHPDLVPYISESPGLGSCLRHPLLYQLFYTSQLNALINEQYQQKLTCVNEAFESQNWSRYLWFHERPYRVEKLAEIQDFLSDEEYWKLLGSVWTDSENLWQYGRLPGYLVRSPRPGKEKMMDEEEQAFLAALPEEFMVFRGHHGHNRLGFSWTLSYWKAQWFANRLNHRRQGVIQAVVRKQDAIAVLLGRGELEIVVDPNQLQQKRTFSRPRRKDWMNEVYQRATTQYPLSHSYHGKWHWEKVERNAATLAKNTKGADRTVVQLFALIHDCKRENEDHDPDHGHRAAAYARELFKEGLLNISESQLELLCEACKYHNDGQVSSDPTIGVCWDADRLDLPRVGITPNPNLLSTQAGKNSVWKI